MYWTAPELLRKVSGQVSVAPKGDVYSFAIILWEIMYSSKSGPYQDINLEPKGERKAKGGVRSPRLLLAGKYSVIQSISPFFLQRSSGSCERLSKGNRCARC